MKHFASIILFSFILLSNSLLAQMQGVYTVSGVGADFPSLQQALNALESQGIDGPVTLNIRAGIYSTNFAIPPVSGSSEENQIIIQSEDMDSSSVRFNYTASSFADDFIFKFNGCSWVTIKHVTLQPLGPGGFSTYTRAVEFANGSHNNSLEFIHFLGRPFVNALTVYSAQGNYCENIHIRNCHFKYGGTAVSIRNDGGISMPNAPGLEVSNCYFEDQNYYAISAINNDQFLISNNLVVNPEDGNNITAMYFGNVDKGGEVSGNQIYIKGTHGIEFSYCFNDPGYRTRVFNNMVSLRAGTYGYGITISAPGNTSASNRSILLAYNSVNVSTGGEQQALNIFRIDSVNIVNNIFAVSGAYPAVYFQGGINEANSFTNNCLYAPEGFLARNQLTATDYSDFESLISDMNFGQSCLNEEPQFYAIDDLHSGSTALLNAGIPVEGITSDIDQELRNSTNPSVGADEIDSSPLTINNINSKKDVELQIFPQPAGSRINLRLEGNEGRCEWQLYDMLGNQKMNGAFNGPDCQISTELIGAGIYLLKFKSELLTRIEKIIIKK
ncbi:MAG: T9SS type A sorting domain-containing protein [Bacteroidetes bacterium]|nr:T9SS type A sorting domain-containing protein [Bacteroidota bacterium]